MPIVHNPPELSSVRTRSLGQGFFRLFLAVTASVAFLPFSVAQRPEIEIEGLAGAEHWVWVEGVDFVEGRGGAKFLGEGTDLSGAIAGGPPNVYYRTTAKYDVGRVSWRMTAPAQMSEKTKLHLRALIDRPAVRMDVECDGQDLFPGALELLSSGLRAPVAFLEWKNNGEMTGSGLSVGPLSAGNHDFEFSAEPKSVQNFTSFIVNGLLLYDGEPALREPVQRSEDGRWWMDGPGSQESPVITGTVKPKISIWGREDGDRIEYLLNGSPFVSETTIEKPGDYELTVSVFRKQGQFEQRVAFAGANFSLTQ